MTPLFRAALLGLSVSTFASPTASGADQVVGTFTVKGKTTPFHQVYATLDKDPDTPTKTYLVVLLSDKPIEPADRAIGRLKELARQGAIHAVRVVWATGYDSLGATPYHEALAHSGEQGVETPTIDLSAFDDKNLARPVEAEVHSKMIGQDWHFSARFKVVVNPGATVEIEPQAPADPPLAEAPDPAAGGATGDPSTLKLQLGRLGYEYKEEPFIAAITDGNLAAVRLFLKLGMSPNIHGSAGNHAMILAAMMCAQGPPGERDDVLLALVGAKGDVNARDENKTTAFIWAAEACAPPTIKVMIDAGANLNATSVGGATALMMATTLGRTEVAELLKRAGAK